MAIVMDKVNALIAAVKSAADALVKLALPTVVILLILEVVFGINMGLITRIVTITGLSVQDLLKYGIGLAVIYKLLWVK